MVIASDYPFIDILGSMLFFFGFVIWFWLLISVFGDVFRRHDIGGFTKFVWCVFVIFVPLLGVLIYLIVNGREMGERNLQQAQAQKDQFDAYVRETAGGPGAEIAHAKGLLENGTITQAEFDQIKQKALA